MTNEIIRPKIVTEDHLFYLDDLRDSGDTNMFGARPFLMSEFLELNEKEASKVLVYWMKTFSERHTNDNP